MRFLLCSMLLGSFSIDEVNGNDCHKSRTELQVVFTYVSICHISGRKRKISYQLLLFVHQQLYSAALLSVSLEIGCKPRRGDKNCVQCTNKDLVKELFDLKNFQTNWSSVLKWQCTVPSKEQFRSPAFPTAKQQRLILYRYFNGACAHQSSCSKICQQDA